MVGQRIGKSWDCSWETGHMIYQGLMGCFIASPNLREGGRRGWAKISKLNSSSPLGDTIQSGYCQFGKANLMEV